MFILFFILWISMNKSDNQKKNYWQIWSNIFRQYLASSYHFSSSSSFLCSSLFLSHETIYWFYIICWVFFLLSLFSLLIITTFIAKKIFFFIIYYSVGLKIYYAYFFPIFYFWNVTKNKFFCYPFALEIRIKAIIEFLYNNIRNNQDFHPYKL